MPIAAFFLQSCITTAPPTDTGSLLGRVMLFDSLGNQVASPSGVKVWQEGRTDSVSTDMNGFWILGNVKAGAGAYTLNATTPGYSLTRWPDSSVLAGKTTTVDVEGLLGIPSFHISIDSIVATSGTAMIEPSFEVYGHHDDGWSLPPSALIFIGGDANFGDGSGIYSTYFAWNALAASSLGTFALQVPLGSLASKGFARGMDCYVELLSLAHLDTLTVSRAYMERFLAPEHYRQHGTRSNVVEVAMP